MDRNRTGADPREPIPWIAWSSLMSIDAVLVAVVWQALFTRTFLDRSPTFAQAWALGSTVWLIYVADRLLDASRLDLTRPHTLRHRFHHRHARTFAIVWVLVLIVAVTVVVVGLSPALIRAGLILATAVLMYGAGVHFVPRNGDAERGRRRFVPKEIRVGVLFAFGVSLSAWTHVSVSDPDAIGALFLATVAAAVLFSLNCLLVSRWEAGLDEAQSFSQNDIGGKSSMTRWLSTVGLVLIPALGVFVPGSAAFWLSGLIGLFGMTIIASFLADENTGYETLTRWERRGLYADWMLWIPPSLIAMIEVIRDLQNSLS
ncbi:hypothetical protein [Neorhodopirellula pilleata]|uniref:Prenyltransferase n=1 Tax=Neorhodopirellula pilleata TaxID=2714738 RepID=A0A5C6A0N3_9BACT|nr:hypothetical protein [Neorhodopirellula pilleata]TWT92976.1 hypothetical protein Pla100_42920 [Neorhodopirellula pilleata]